MKRDEPFYIKKRRVIIISWLCLISFTVFQTKADQLSDSLMQIVQSESDAAVVFGTLRDLSHLYKDKPEEVNYLTLLLNKAQEADSTLVVYEALSNLSRYYFNASDLDSLTYWAGKVDSLVRKRGDNPNAYYDVHSFTCKYNQSQGLNELSIYEAIKMQNKAKESNHIYGQICSAETIGVIYKASNREKEATAAFQEALDMLDKIHGDYYYRIYIKSNQIEALFTLDSLSDMEKNLQEYDHYITKWEEKRRRVNPDNILNESRWIYYSFYTDYYLKTGRLDKAKVMLDKNIAYGRRFNDTNIYNSGVQYCYYVKACYDQQINKHAQAIASLDSILNHFFEPEFAQKKIESLTALGRYEEATLLYKELLQITETQNNSTSAKQVSQLRTLNDVNNTELQSLELKIGNTKAKQNQYLLFLSLGILGVLIVLAYVMFQLLKRSRRLRNDLIKEKQSLLKSREHIRQAMKKAENASQMKSTFIANVSHEIRTPLNAIVGFSSLVVDPGSEEEEKKEYASIISNNSDLLLNIINDILNLSKMETGNMEFKLGPCELFSSCKEVVASVDHRLQPGVKSGLSFPRNTFVLTTDPLRLRQLLLNLLINAAKFTKEGRIDLSVDIDEEKRQVVFSVTDTGCGIPLELQEKIFERFEKVHEYIQGTGLGLAICKMIASNLGGSLFVDPGYTGGARFVFIHPFEPPHPNEKGL